MSGDTKRRTQSMGNRLKSSQREQKPNKQQKSRLTFMQLPVWLVKSTLDLFSALLINPGVALWKKCIGNVTTAINNK